ncbi:MAG: hypothetical protein EOP62_02425 [Sphingomonadales bacterium]|nr:MAG: hypothetical protein EOP62_02425 [Sphingomonadales bacterium]
MLEAEAAGGSVGALQDLLVLFTSAILLSLIIAVISLAILQLFRPWLRGGVQWMTLARWHRRSEYFGRVYWNPDRGTPRWLARFFPDEPPLSELLHRKVERDAHFSQSTKKQFPWPSIALLLQPISNGLLMKKIQDAASLVLARPSVYIDEFLYLTDHASEGDRHTVLYLDFISRREPGAITRSAKEEDRGFVEAVAVAQQSVGTAAERHLDELQLRLEGALANWTRVLSIMLGMAVAFIGANEIWPRPIGLALIIGATGGLLASLLHDMAAGYVSRRR